MSAFNKTTLSNGLRIISIPKPESPSTTVMVIVGVGSRFETDKESGISHFIEHNVFKGTTKRSKRNEIINDIESVGGITNAATGHEYTFYWAKSAPQFAQNVLDVILDISQHMTFPKDDLEIERGNVIEEINMYEDNPMQKIMSDYVEFVWDGHAIGRRIIGTKENIASFTREQMIDYVKTNYTPDRTIVVVSGGGDLSVLEKHITDTYGQSTTSNTNGPKPLESTPVGPRVLTVKSETAQSHLCLGYTTFGRFDDRRYSLDVLNTVLGSGMSSRLFTRIREELGLAYYIGSDNWEYDETGLWFARAGVDTARVDDAVTAIVNEFKKISETTVLDGELSRAKEYLKGKTLLSVETSDDLAHWYGFQELLEAEVLSPREYNSKIDNISASDIQSVAQEIIQPENLHFGIIGPFDDKKRFEDLVGIL